MLLNSHTSSYDRHVDIVKELLEKQSFPEPKIFVKEVKNLYDFTFEEIEIIDYKHHDFNHRVEVAV